MTQFEKVDLAGQANSRKGEVEIAAQNLLIAKSEPQTRSLSGTDLAIGGGGGGAIVILANILVSNITVKETISALAPAMTLIIMQLYQWTSNEISSNYVEWKQEKKRLKLLRQAQEGLNEARRQLKEVESDSNANFDHKVDLRKQVQMIEKNVLNLNMKGIVILE